MKKDSEEKIVTNYSFLENLKISIFKFDKYYEITQQKTRKILVFLFELVVLVTLILTGTIILRLNQTYDYAYKFIQDNLPDFTISKDGFHMDIEEPLIYKNSEYFNSVAIFDNGEDNKQYLEEANNGNSIYIVVTKNSLIFKIPGAVTTEYKFNDIFKEKKVETTNTDNTTENAVENSTEQTLENTAENNNEQENTEKKTINEINKKYLLDLFNEETMKQTIANLALYLFLLLFISLMIISLCNILALSILGYVFAKIIKLPFKYSKVFNMSVAASVLPTILLCIYMVINILTGFVIAKFDILYSIVSYIYLAAALLILRSSFVKTQTKKEAVAEAGKNVEVTIEDSDEADENDENDETEDSDEEDSSDDEDSVETED